MRAATPVLAVGDALVRRHHRRHHTVMIGNPPHPASNMCRHRFWCWLADMAWEHR